MTSARVGRDGARWPRPAGRSRGLLQHPLLSAEPARARHGAGGELGDVRASSPGTTTRTGSSRDTDWNWRRRPRGGRRAAGRRGHRDPLGGPHQLHPGREAGGDPGGAVDLRPRAAEARRGRSRPSRGARARPRRVAIDTDDAAQILLRYPSGARGTVTISQVNVGRKNSLQWDIAGAEMSAAWDSETPDHLWLGHRDQPNRILQRDPGLMNAGRRRGGEPAGRACGGLRRHVPRDVPRRSTATSPRAGAARTRPGRASRTATARCCSATRCWKARESGRWVAGARQMRRTTMKLGILTAPFPDWPLERGGGLGRLGRDGGAGGRLLARGGRRGAALCGHEPHRRATA